MKRCLPSIASSIVDMNVLLIKLAELIARQKKFVSSD